MIDDGILAWRAPPRAARDRVSVHCQVDEPCREGIDDGFAGCAGADEERANRPSAVAQEPGNSGGFAPAAAQPDDRQDAGLVPPGHCGDPVSP